MPEDATIVLINSGLDKLLAGATGFFGFGGAVAASGRGMLACRVGACHGVACGAVRCGLFFVVWCCVD